MKVTSFGSYNIPQSQGEWTFNPQQTNPTVELLAASGVFDNLGDAIVLRPGTIRVSFAVWGVDWDAVDAELDNAKAAFFPSTGRDLLKLTYGEDVSTSRQALARCVSFDIPKRWDGCHIVRCQAEFVMEQSTWDNIAVSNLTENSASFNVDNSGSNAKVQRTLIIRINGALPASNITLTNTTTGLSFVYDANADSVAGGEYREIDCGAASVVDQLGNDKYEFLTIGNNQIEFMALEPGINAFTLSPSGTNIDFTWQKAYI
jgi:hypothetical protein